MGPVRQLRHILRRLARAPLFTAFAVLTLAIGIGATTAVFTVVHGVLLKPLPFPEPERLVGVWHTAPGLGWERVNQSPALYLTYREESELFEESGMWDATQVSVTSLAEPEEVEAIRVTDGILPLLRARPFHGRLFTAEDDSPGTPETVILSYPYWQERFGGEPAAVGKTLTVDGTPCEILGVLRPDFHFLDEDPALVLPFRLDRSQVFFGNFSYQGIARLRPEATLEQANTDLERMITMALERFPIPGGLTAGMVRDAGLAPSLRPLKDEVVGDVGKVLWLLLGTVALVLLIACANVANLLLVRAEARQREIAVRAALGGGRGRIGGELLAESAVLGLAGGACGLGLAHLAVRLLVWLAPRDLPRLDEIAIDPTVVLFTLGVSLLAAAVFGALPALRLDSGNLAEALKEGGRGGGGSKGRSRVRDLLVTAQVAVALILLIASGLMVRSFRALETADPGFDAAEEVLTLRLSIPEAEVAETAAVAQTHEALLAALEAIPGVETASLASSVPMAGWNSFDPIFVEDFPTEADQIPPLRRFKWVAPGYFETVGTPLLAGRAITWDDVHEKRRVAVVSDSFVRAYWNDRRAALGRRIRFSPDSPWREIVGVAGDVYEDGVDEEVAVTVYWPMMMADFWDEGDFVPRSMAYLLRSPRVGSAALLAEVSEAVWSVDRNLPLADVRTLEEVRRRSTARTSFTLVMLVVAAGAAVLLGVVGIYGVTSYAVSQRTREIGVRLAFGARRRDVSRLVLRHGLLLAAAGVLVGLGTALASSRLISALLFGVSPLDPATYAAGGLGVTLLALTASYLPARRAARVDPIETLRWE